ncbi:MAG: alpha/beta fold hydrolase [Bryobacteraceae bacterium]
MTKLLICLCSMALAGMAQGVAPVDRAITLLTPDGVSLAGTLTVPLQKVPAAAVVLAPGAGATDRDDTIFKHKPFAVLAGRLAAEGVAVLRLDSRGVGGSGGKYADATGETLANDLLAAVVWLKHQPEIDPRRVGLIGHSQGGVVVARAAATSADVAFLVLLAAPGLPDTDLVALRIAAAGRARGASAEDIAAVQKGFRSARARQAAGEDDAALRAALAAARMMLPPGVDPPAPALEAAITQQIEAAKSPNGAYFLTHDPRESYRRLRCPVLALSGSLDQNVPANENLAAIRAAIQEDQAVNTTTQVLDGLNHFFQTARTGSFTEMAQIEEAIAPKALDAISSWVRRR